MKTLNLTVKCILKSNVNEITETKYFTVPYQNWKNALLKSFRAEFHEHEIYFVDDNEMNHLVNFDPRTDLQSFKGASHDKIFPVQT